MPINIEQRTQEKCLILMICGSFSGVTAAKEFRVAIHNAMTRSQRLILVNLSELGDSLKDGMAQVDDFGMESLLAGAFVASHWGGALRIFGAASAVAEAFAAVGASRLLSDAATEMLAVDDMQALGLSQPFDILQFVRDEARSTSERGGIMADLPEPQPGD